MLRIHPYPAVICGQNSIFHFHVPIFWQIAAIIRPLLVVDTTLPDFFLVRFPFFNPLTVVLFFLLKTATFALFPFEIFDALLAFFLRFMVDFFAFFYGVHGFLQSLLCHFSPSTTIGTNYTKIRRRKWPAEKSNRKMHAVVANLIARKLTYYALRRDVRNEMLLKEHFFRITKIL